jgi:hypothetical protein
MAKKTVDLVPGKAVGFRNNPRPIAKAPKPSVAARPKAQPAQKLRTAQDMANPTANQILAGGKKGHVQYK